MEEFKFNLRKIEKMKIGFQRIKKGEEEMKS